MLLGMPRSVGLSPHGSVLASAATWHALGAAFAAPGAGQGAVSQRVGASSGICTDAPALVLWILGTEKGD